MAAPLGKLRKLLGSDGAVRSRTGGAAVLTVVRLVAALALLAGCGTSVVAGTASAEGQTASSDTGDTSGGVGTGAYVCSLFSPAEMKALIGSSPPGLPLVGEFGGGACQWQDPDDTGNNTLTLELGAPDTAPGGKLPDFKPENRIQELGDGIVRDVLGRVYFVCGHNGECRAGLTSQRSISEDVQRTVDLVPTIRAKVGG